MTMARLLARDHEMIKLTSVTIENFRGIEHLEIPLDGSLTVLVGINAAGKTSVLDALAVGLSRILHYFPGATGIDFKKSDFRRDGFSRVNLGLRSPELFPPNYFHSWTSAPVAPFVRVSMCAKNDLQWSASKVGYARGAKPPSGRNDLKALLPPIAEKAMEGDRDVVVPVVAAYRNSRAVIDTPQRRRDFKTEFPRFLGLDGALNATANYRQIVEWLLAEEDIERRERERRDDKAYRSPLLSVVRQAVEKLLPGYSNLRTEVRPLRVEIDREVDKNRERFEILSLEELSDGYRIMLALVIDLAHRMATTNPFMADPLEAPAVVLIDEVDLHLHPRWQQRVLADLRRVFPNTQFIVSTHSPQVLTMVEERHIVVLDRDTNGRIIRRGVDMDPYGAESGRVLEAIFGVEQRPPEDLNDFVRDLGECWKLIKANRFDEAATQEMYQSLKERAPADPVILRLDLEMRRRRAMIARGQTP